MAEKITIKEVKFAQKACADAATLAQQTRNADEVKAAAMMGIFERLLGVKSMDDVAQTSLLRLWASQRRLRSSTPRRSGTAIKPCRFNNFNVPVAQLATKPPISAVIRKSTWMITKGSES
jgi:hypothetical protein